MSSIWVAIFFVVVVLSSKQKLVTSCVLDLVQENI